MLASIYGLDVHDGISKEQFLQLCPALVQQQIEGSCEPVTTTTVVEEKVGVTSAECKFYLVII